jgi:hypothetical protein
MRQNSGHTTPRPGNTYERLQTQVNLGDPSEYALLLPKKEILPSFNELQPRSRGICRRITAWSRAQGKVPWRERRAARAVDHRRKDDRGLHALRRAGYSAARATGSAG